MKGKILATAMAACLLGSNVQASDSNGSYAIKGAGLGSCAKFLESVKAQDNLYYVYGGWVEGYLTAMNRHQADTFDIAPWQSTALMLKIAESFCAKRPDMQFHQIVSSITQTLDSDRLSSGGEFKNLGTKEKPIILQAQMIKIIQQALADLGFLGGSVDGVYGDGTKDALGKFQESKGLVATRLPDQGTLFELFKAQKSQGQ
ncbi:peptidoglycan-binding domain-containing protein [Neptunomonas sp. XY-337]|uniref:peptidoglycan-binding domain-containing protein n=1 Tax=Neptunomonas sp. XY-337 TaxID=2561897 RepID=UPI0010A9AB90|nr:peptidoglycan-binding domain-containing protein [Neptunomonas sp. XY-337]